MAAAQRAAEPANYQSDQMLLKKVSLENFRTFRKFELADLGRVNLLVGTNNCGKTTVLEAINILMGNGEARVLWSILSRRGENFWGERDPSEPGSDWQVDIRRLFRDHGIDVGKSFQISADTDHGPIAMIAIIADPRSVRQTLFETEVQPAESAEDFLPPLVLSLNWLSDPPKELVLPINHRGGITLNAIRRSARSGPREGFPLRYVIASSLTAEIATTQFEDIVLTPEEELVTEAIRIIEPEIERIASSGSDRIRAGTSYSTRGGIVVKMKGGKDRIPIGSMGDGIWRMLGLALEVVQSAGGTLLVDEIDTGLHHTIMKDMWRFLYNCSKRYDVQIIATTHSRDCYQSLAAICRADVAENSDVTIQRIERDREEAVVYTEQEIVAAAERDIEVR